MGFRDAMREATGRDRRATAASEGGLDLNELGFEGVNTNPWIELDLVSAPGILEDHLEGLPPGKLLSRDSGGSRAMPMRLAWVSDEADLYTESWYAAAGRFAETGLWPVLTEGAWGSEPGWLPALVGPGEVHEDAEALLARTYEAAASLPDMEPWRTQWRGMAPAEPARNRLVEARPVNDQRGLLIVPVERPADVPAALGWVGAEGYEYTPTAVSAVLRSLEKRFGAVLVGMGADTLELSVARRPRDPEQALLLAGELYGFAPDVLDQAHGGDLNAYAEALMHQREWELWWD